MQTDTLTINIPVTRLPGNDDVPLPDYQSEHAAGMDLHAAVEETVTIPAGEIRLIPCGFAMAVPVGYEAQVRPRSGIATKFGISMPNAPGTIDADYRGQVMVPLINHSTKPFEVTRSMRIAQMIIKPVPRAQWQEVKELPPTDRGAGGFGHTGR
jgi:dUTP pyrophosphatase